MVVPPHVALHAAVSATISAGVTLLAAAAAGPDYAGIAALVTAISGLIGTLGAVYLALRRRDTQDQALDLLLAEHRAREHQHDEEQT